MKRISTDGTDLLDKKKLARFYDEKQGSNIISIGKETDTRDKYNQPLEVGSIKLVENTTFS